MKKLTLSLVAAAMMLAGTYANAKTLSEAVMEAALNDLRLSAASEVHINNLINWKVGEYTDSNIGLMGMPAGTMKKIVDREEGNTIWMNQLTDGSLIGKHKIEVQMDRADGKILQLIQDGQKQEIPNDKLEIISQDSTTVTVPAGTFEVIHIVAKSEKIKKLEAWANPRDISLDGMAKTYVESGMFPMTLELTGHGGR